MDLLDIASEDRKPQRQLLDTATSGNVIIVIICGWSSWSIDHYHHEHLHPSYCWCILQTEEETTVTNLMDSNCIQVLSQHHLHQPQHHYEQHHHDHHRHYDCLDQYRVSGGSGGSGGEGTNGGGLSYRVSNTHWVSLQWWFLWLSSWWSWWWSWWWWSW